MPYIRGRDFTRIRELVETVKELSEKKEYLSIPGITTRALTVMERYVVGEEEEEKE